MNSQPCWWEIPVLKEGITAWGMIIPQSSLISSQTVWPVPSAACNTRLSFSSPALSEDVSKEGSQEGTELPPALPVAEALGNTSTRFVASPGDFSLLCCSSALRHSLFIVCPSNPGTVKARPINSALLGFMSCAWPARCYDSWDEIRLQVNLFHIARNIFRALWSWAWGLDWGNGRGEGKGGMRGISILHLW